MFWYRYYEFFHCIDSLWKHSIDVPRLILSSVVMIQSEKSWKHVSIWELEGNNCLKTKHSEREKKTERWNEYIFFNFFCFHPFALKKWCFKSGCNRAASQWWDVAVNLAVFVVRGCLSLPQTDHHINRHVTYVLQSVSDTNDPDSVFQMFVNPCLLKQPHAQFLPVLDTRLSPNHLDWLRY